MALISPASPQHIVIFHEGSRSYLRGRAKCYGEDCLADAVLLFSQSETKGEIYYPFRLFQELSRHTPGGEGASAFAERLDEDGYKHTKGALQLPYNQPIPDDRIAETLAEGKAGAR